ncbi:hypothetical protein ACHQM5_012597 [Ranunculus cassubicifolius]
MSSCCGSNCGCDSGCKCGGCGKCKMSLDLGERNVSEALIVGIVPAANGFSEERLEMSVEEASCNPSCHFFSG